MEQQPATLGQDRREETVGAERAPVGSRLAGWLLPVALFLSVFGVYAATVEHDVITNDAFAASVGAWRIASTGEPWLDDVDRKGFGGGEFNRFRTMWLAEAPNGHVVAQRMGGPIIVGVPFYWLLGQSDDPRDFTLTAGGIGAAFATGLTVVFIFLALRRRLSTTLSFVASMVFALTTPTWSVSANGLWTHTVTQLGIAGAAYALAKDRWWLAGVLLGVGMWGRPHLALIAAVVGLGVAWSRRDIRPGVGLAVPTLSSLGMLAAWNRLNFGEWSIGGSYGYADATQAVQGYAGGLGEQLLNYLGFFVSPDRGLLVWTPLIVLMLPALVRSRRILPSWSVWLAVGGLLYTFIQLRLNYFPGGDGFYGYRHGLELLTCLTPALAFSIARMGRIARIVAPVLIAVQFAAIALGAIVRGFYVTIDRVWTDNSIWLALRDQPVAVGIWLGLAVLIGALVSLRLNQRPAETAAKASGYGPG